MKPSALAFLLLGIAAFGGVLKSRPDVPAGADIDERGRMFRVTAPPPYWTDNRLLKQLSYGRLDNPRSRGPFYSILDPRERDFERFTLPIRLVDSRVLEGRELASAISEATGVPILLDGEYSRSSMVVPASGVTAREIMDSMKRVLGGHWLQDKGGWVLTKLPPRLPLITLTDRERDQRRAANIRSLVVSLQEPQWRTLGRSGVLNWGELTQEQKVLVLDQLKLDFHDPGRSLQQAPLEAALSGNGVTLRLIGAGGSARFGIACTAADGGVYAPTSPFYNPITRELTWGVLPPR